MPHYKSEKEAILHHQNYIDDSDITEKYSLGGGAYLLYRAIQDTIPENSIVLDIGCNSGAVGRLLMKKRNIVCFGIDICPEMIVRAAAKGIFAKLGKAEALSWSDNYFDIVMLMEILEHVYDPQKVLGEAVRVVKPQGIITGSVPHPKGRTGIQGFVKHRWHARVFNKNSLKKLLKSRLKNIEIKNIYADPDVTGLPSWMWFSGRKGG